MEFAIPAGEQGQVLSNLSEMAVTSEILAGSADLTEILQRLAQRAKELTRADYAAISTFDDAGILNRFIYTGIDDEAARRLGDPPKGRGLLGELANCDRPLRLAHLSEHPKSSGWPAGHPDMDAFLGVPIRTGGRAIGSLYMTRKRGEAPFTEIDEAGAAVLSLQAAVSLASALARERSNRLFLLEERARIAHDLHDGTIQTLYAMGLECDALANDQEFPAEVRNSMASVVTRLNELIGDIRGYITMLEAATTSPEPELTRDLAFIIRQIVPPSIATVVNISAAALQTFTLRETEDLLYIAREALSNAVRHASPNKIAVDLRQDRDQTALTVQDNGAGFDPAEPVAGTANVPYLTDAAHIGGELTVLGIPGMGTTVRVSIPRRNND